MSATAVHICLEDNNNDNNEEPISHYLLEEMMVGNRGHIHMDFYWPEYHRGEERRLQQKYPHYKSWVNYYFVREIRNQEYLTPEAQLLWAHITNLVPREGVLLCERYVANCKCDRCGSRDPNMIYCVIYNKVVIKEEASAN